MTIPESLMALLVERRALAAQQENKARAYEVFMGNISFLLNNLEETSKRVAALEAAIRADTLAEYDQMGVKNPYPGVQVKEMTRLDYESSKALEWAKRTGVALLLNTKTFETLVKADPEEFPFVEIFKVPQVQIAQDLEKVLG